MQEIIEVIKERYDHLEPIIHYNAIELQSEINQRKHKYSENELHILNRLLWFKIETENQN